MRMCDVRIPNPFDDSAATRLARMGLIKPDGSQNEDALEVLARVYAALFFDRLCDSFADFEQMTLICEGLIKQQEAKDPRQKMLSICLQYDALHLTLPDPVWWIIGNEQLVAVYVQAFLQHLARIAGNASDMTELEIG